MPPLINAFLLDNDLDLRTNPCISPDFCLDWKRCQSLLREGRYKRYDKSKLELSAGTLTLLEDDQGDHAWMLEVGNGRTLDSKFLDDGVKLASNGTWYYPAHYQNLIHLKNRMLEADGESTIFPGTAGDLGSKTLGVGARFTTLHWPAVEWAMAKLGIGMTANQNSIPRELVYDVDAMLGERLESVPFAFIGCEVPEGHQGQSVQGMSHGAVLSKLKTGFHRQRIPWSFNADHQPIGGKFDPREDALVEGSLFASYITFDLSPELAQTQVPHSPEERADWVRREVSEALLTAIRNRVEQAGCSLGSDTLNELVCRVWPAMRKMKRRDEKYRQARENAFASAVGRAYLRELSIDELPGLTTSETTAVMLAFCEAMEMPVNFVAPAFGFQKNAPYPDNDQLRKLIETQWEVCQEFGVSIGFHSGSGKSAENYRVMGEVTKSHLEIKTSGRFTYEMGLALSHSTQPEDKQLWQDWYRFTTDLAVAGAFADDETERAAAREFIVKSLDTPMAEDELFASDQSCRRVIDTLSPTADRMLFFEYNFLYVLAANGRSAKEALGDHGPNGYRQRARFYSISDEARLEYARGVARYLIFLAENVGLVTPTKAATTKSRLDALSDYDSLLNDIASLS